TLLIVPPNVSRRINKTRVRCDAQFPAALPRDARLVHRRRRTSAVPYAQAFGVVRPPCARSRQAIHPRLSRRPALARRATEARESLARTGPVGDQGKDRARGRDPEALHGWPRGGMD